MAKREAKIDSCLLLAEHLGLAEAAVGSNFAFSPLSIRAALSLAAAGSGGETLQQMLTFLGSATAADLNSSAAALLGSVRELSQSSDDSNSVGSQLSFVNGIWVDQTMDLKPSFQQTATSLYGAAAKTVDFQNQAQKVAMEVNDFVEKVTNGLIKDLIPRESVSEDTRIILANALYFKGLWANNFSRSETRNEEFHLLDGSTTKVPFMTSKRKQFISKFDGFKVLRLPYQILDQQQRSFSMLLFLPDNRDGLSRLIQKAVSEPNFLNRHFPNNKVEVGKFMIPKFKISSNFEATEVLKVLGLNSPFDGQANFSEMVLDPTNRLHVSSVHHKATVEVEEEGTVAAAATGMTMQLMCYTPPVNFEADHPFMFAIREEVTGAVLFLGHVANPSIVE